MMAEISQTITQFGDTLLSVVQSVTTTLRTTVNNDLILLLIAGILAFFFQKKVKEGAISAAWATIILSIIFYLVLRYI